MLDRLGESKNIRNLLYNAIKFLVEILMVVDNPQVRMSRPCLYHTLVEDSGLLYILMTVGVVDRCIELLGTIGS